MIIKYLKRYKDVVFFTYFDEAIFKEGDNGLFITLVPNGVNNVLLFVNFTTLGIFNEF